jgi:hypothetical protein
MSSKPTDQKLYDRIKKKVYKDIPTHSAYRSGQLVKQYKEAYEKKYGKNKKAYTGTKKKDEGLSRWYRENWKTSEGSTTYKKKGDIFRPTKRITKKTPTTLKELSKKQIERAKKEKKKTGRVKVFKK